MGAEDAAVSFTGGLAHHSTIASKINTSKYKNFGGKEGKEPPHHDEDDAADDYDADTMTMPRRASMSEKASAKNKSVGRLYRVSEPEKASIQNKSFGILAGKHVFRRDDPPDDAYHDADVDADDDHDAEDAENDKHFGGKGGGQKRAKGRRTNVPEGGHESHEGQ